MPEPSPAPLCTYTSCPASTSSRTPAGVSATRYSSDLTSVGTPTFTLLRPPFPCLRSPKSDSCHQLTSAQRQPELDPVPSRAEVAPGQLLDPPDPVAQRVAVTVKPPSRPLPLPVLF